jgi:hypothetical protein
MSKHKRSLDEMSLTENNEDYPATAPMFKKPAVVQENPVNNFYLKRAFFIHKCGWISWIYIHSTQL